MMRVAGFPSMMHVAGSRGVFVFELEWCCSMFLGAMYAGVVMILNLGQICYREGMPRTFPSSVCFGFEFSGYSREFSLRLKSISHSNWTKFDWTIFQQLYRISSYPYSDLVCFSDISYGFIECIRTITTNEEVAINSICKLEDQLFIFNINYFIRPLLIHEA